MAYIFTFLTTSRAGGGCASAKVKRREMFLWTSLPKMLRTALKTCVCSAVSRAMLDWMTSPMQESSVIGMT